MAGQGFEALDMLGFHLARIACRFTTGMRRTYKSDLQMNRRRLRSRILWALDIPGRASWVRSGKQCVCAFDVPYW